MLLKIEEATYLGGHRFMVRFNDGRSGTVDIRPTADEGPGAVFAPLADEDFVRRFTLEPGELDIAPEYLYFLAFREEPVLHDQFVAWGYLEQPART